MPAMFGLFSKKEKAKKATRPTKGAVQSSVPATDAAADVAPVATPAEQAQRQAGKHFHAPTQCILRPHVTEKSASGSAVGSYTFIVERSATKQEITRALMTLYGARPKKINIVVGPDRVRVTRYGSRRQRGLKKAIVTFPKETQIDIAKAPHSVS